MFSYLENPTQRYWIIALLIIWAALLFGGFILGSSGSGHRMPTWTRMASSATLVLAGFSWFLISRNYGVTQYGLLIAIGMTFGFLGDLFLAGVLPGGRSEIGGIAAFAVGHIFYIIAIWRFGSAHGLDTTGARWGSLIAWWLIAIIAWYFVVYSGADGPSLQWVVLPYALLLASTAGLGTGLALQEPMFILLAVGAALFLLSDLILGGMWFADLDFPLIDDVVWLTYGPGQMLIVYSIGTAIKFVLG